MRRLRLNGYGAWNAERTPKSWQRFMRGSCQCGWRINCSICHEKSRKAELGRRLKAVEDRERQSAITAQAIREYLDTLGDRKVDLVELGRKILQGSVAPAVGVF